MNKLFTKIGVVLVGIAMSIGVGVAVGGGKSAVPTYASNEETYTLTGFADQSAYTGEVKTYSSLVASIGTGSTAPTYYSNGTATRFYKNNTFTVSAADGLKVTSVVLTSSNSTLGNFSTVDDAYSAGTWTGSEDSITFSVSAAARLTSVVVTTDTGVEFGTLASIAVKAGSTHKTLFEVGDTFSAEGMTIVATDDKSVTKNVQYNASGVSFTGYNMSSAGVQTVTVSYTLNAVTKTTTYSITVANKVTYTISSTTALSNPTALTGLTASFSTTYTDKNQLTSGKVQTLL